MDAQLLPDDREGHRRRHARKEVPAHARAVHIAHDGGDIHRIGVDCVGQDEGLEDRDHDGQPQHELVPEELPELLRYHPLDATAADHSVLENLRTEIAMSTRVMAKRARSGRQIRSIPTPFRMIARTMVM